MVNSVQGDTVTYNGRHYKLLETTATSYIFTDGIRTWNIAKTEFIAAAIEQEIPKQTYLHKDLTDVSKDQHHTKAHKHNGTDGSGEVSYNDLTNKPTTFNIAGVNSFVITEGDSVPSEAQSGDIIFEIPV